MSALQNCRPENVFAIFEQLCAIPCTASATLVAEKGAVEVLHRACEAVETALHREYAVADPGLSAPARSGCGCEGTK